MIKYYRDGRAIVESSRSDDRTAAKKLLRQREADIDRGLPLGPNVGKIRFAEAATDIQTEYRTNGRRTLDHV
ncbi:MAG: site-specific integrase, partial [Planctomycetaceae bacterium]